MKKRDVSAYMSTLTLQEFDETITRETAAFMNLRKDLFLVALGLLVAGGAALYFDVRILASLLLVLALFFHHHAIAAGLEASMRQSNWWLALLIQRQSNDLLAIRQKFGLVDDEEDEHDEE
jgi:hypothetical protein